AGRPGGPARGRRFTARARRAGRGPPPRFQNPEGAPARDRPRGGGARRRLLGRARDRFLPADDGRLVSRFRSSQTVAAQSRANFGIKGTLANFDSSVVFGFEVPMSGRRIFVGTSSPPH